MIFQTDFTEMNFLHFLLPRDIDNCDVTMETKGISNVLCPFLYKSNVFLCGYFLLHV